MTPIVLDASAALAVLFREAGADEFDRDPRLMDRAVMSAVNVAEVQTKLVVKGVDAERAWSMATQPIREVVDFNGIQAKIAGSLIAETRSRALSLADRACLALGITLKAAVYTADRQWKGLRVGVPIHLIR
jgi:ribonuclease VapC